MRPLLLPLFFASLALVGSANAAVVGIVAPVDGPYSILGQQVLRGARAALQAAGHEIIEVNESCEPDSGTAIAESLVNGKANVALGFLCSESLSGGIEFLAASNIPALTLSSRATGLIEDAQKYNWPLYRLSPSLSDEADAVSQAIINRWKGQPIALIDDGTIYGRELIDNIRLELENLGLKPSFVDTIRPNQDNQLSLVRRLARMNVAHLFVAADRNDVAIIARDAQVARIPLSVMSGESMKAANIPVPTPIGTLAVIEPDYSASPEAKALIAQLQQNGPVVEGYTLPAYGAGQIIHAALSAAGNEQKPLHDILNSMTFETILGQIRFTELKGLSNNPFKLQQWNGEAFVEPTTP